MRQWLALLFMFVFSSAAGVSLGAEFCSKVFTPSAVGVEAPVTSQQIRAELDYFFAEVSQKTVDSVLKRIEKNIAKNQNIDLVQISKTAQLYYKSLQDPFFKRILTNLYYKKNADQLVRTEEFGDALRLTLRKYGLLNEKQSLRLRYLQAKAPISWFNFIALQGALNIVLYNSAHSFLLTPVFLPKLAHPTFLSPITQYQKAAIFAEKVFASGVTAYFAISLAWVLFDEDARDETMATFFEAYSEWQKTNEMKQKSVEQQIRSSISPEQLALDSEKVLQEADQILLDLEKNQY